MAEPIRYEITLHGHAWELSRDGRRLHHYSHADRAVREAVNLARELERTGQPASVWVGAGKGSFIEVRPEPEPTPSFKAERSSVVPSRSPSG